MSPEAFILICLKMESGREVGDRGRGRKEGKERGVRDSERERWRQREEEEDIDKWFSNGGKRTTSGMPGVANNWLIGEQKKIKKYYILNMMY